MSVEAHHCITVSEIVYDGKLKEVATALMSSNVVVLSQLEFIALTPIVVIPELAM